MAIEKEKIELKNTLLQKLESNGIQVEKVSQKPFLIKINNTLYNIKSPTNSRPYTYGGTTYNYEISYDVIKNVSYIIFLLDNLEKLFIIPAEELKLKWENFYETNKINKNKDLSRRISIIHKDDKNTISIKDTIDIDIEEYLNYIENIPIKLEAKMTKIKIIDIASARSGDKNNVCNIGVMAKSKADYETLKKYLTADIVKAHFKGLIKGKVDRYEWDALESLNFVCHEALDGGASRSLRMDTLGKNFSSHLLRMEIETD